MTPPPRCAACGATGLEAHCESHTCAWGRCKKCRAVTGIVKGVPRAIGGVPP